MDKTRLKILIGTIVVTVFVGNIAFGFFLQQKKQERISTVTVVPSSDNISYQGQEGKDALTLLKGKATIEQDKSGLVVVINGRKADSLTHEYWGFYVNGTLAPVGPADYKTKDGEKIEWKIEKY